MEDIGNILVEELESMRGRIVANMQSADQVVTGQTVDSIKVEQYAPNAARITARPYFSALETGTQPWRNQYPKPPRFFVDIIREWADAKGLSLNAFLTAGKIMREGSLLYRTGGRKDIFTNEVEATKSAITSRLTASLTAAFRDAADFGQYRDTYPDNI